MLCRSHAETHDAPIAPSVARALSAIKRYDTAPDQIDHAILCAINLTLYLAGNGNDRVSDGFNKDIERSGRGFCRQ